MSGCLLFNCFAEGTEENNEVLESRKKNRILGPPNEVCRPHHHDILYVPSE
jgi:hypothetical protein